MAIESAFNGYFMGIQWDLMMFNGYLMGFHDTQWVFHGYLMDFIAIEWLQVEPSINDIWVSEIDENNQPIYGHGH